MVRGDTDSLSMQVHVVHRFSSCPSKRKPMCERGWQEPSETTKTVGIELQLPCCVVRAFSRICKCFIVLGHGFQDGAKIHVQFPDGRTLVLKLMLIQENKVKDTDFFLSFSLAVAQRWLTRLTPSFLGRGPGWRGPMISHRRGHGA